MYSKVLVPLDGSELAECALVHVKSLVKDGAVQEVIILNVFRYSIPMVIEGQSASYIDDNVIKKRAGDESTKYLAEVESRLRSEGFKVKTESLEGDRPAETISAYAQKNGVEMIILATHGYTGLKRLMFGSVALEVLHDSHVPVLLIRPESCRT
jgi:nucleotide-binding universal stress UspA family protein